MQKETARHVRYASGYTALENFDAAALELEAIAFEDRFLPAVLEAHLNLRFAAKHWDAVVGIGRKLAHLTPENETAWIHCALCSAGTRTRRGSTGRVASRVLKKAK